MFSREKCDWQWLINKVHFCFVTMLGYSCHQANNRRVQWLGIKDFSTSNIFSSPLTHRLQFLSIIWWHFYARKHPFVRDKFENAFKNSLVSKPLKFYRSVFNKLGNRCQKCTNVQIIFYEVYKFDFKVFLLFPVAIARSKIPVWSAIYLEQWGE